MKFKIIILILLSFPAILSANSYEIYVRGKEKVTITKSNISLSDLAQVTSLKNDLDDVVVSLGKISIEKSPAPGKEFLLSSSKIVQKIRDEGFNLNKIGYVFPKNIVVKRAGRLLTDQEVKNAINEYFKKEKREVTLLNIALIEKTYVLPEDLSVEVASYSRDPINKLKANFTLNVLGGTGSRQKVLATCSLEEWKDIPMANRQIYKGEVLKDEDFIMARMNLSKLPKDAFDNGKEVLGKEAIKNISQGEIFSNRILTIPPIIREGDKIKILYQSKLLSAMATGIALENGGINQKIKVKNDSSNKNLEAYVVEEDLVRVNK